jgi:endonuclease/exonuclease/phosphatase family metal-dependent hydrolase
MEKIRKLNRFGSWTDDRPVFLMGDFNSKPGGKVYRTFVGDENSGDPDQLVDSVEGGFGIDWILYRGDVKVNRYENVDYNVDGVYPSDHKPVVAEFEILKK